MARKGQGMMVPTTRSAYTDPARNAYPVPRLSSPSPSSGGDPTYSRRLAGIRERQAYESAAGEAGALTRTSLGLGEGGGGYYNAIRGQLIQQAGAQTATHFMLRSRLAEQMETSELRRRAEIRDAARFALDSYLQGRRLDLEERGLEQRGELAREGFALQRRGMRDDREYRQSTLDLQREQNRQTVADRATDRAQRGYEFEENQRMREEELASRDRNTRRTNRNRNAVANQRRQDATNKALADAPGYWQNQAEAAGYDLSAFEVVGGSGEVAQKRFDDTVKALATQNPNANPNDIIRQAAQQTGLQLREGVTDPVELPWEPTGKGARSSAMDRMRGGKGRNRRRDDVRSAVGDAAGSESPDSGDQNQDTAPRLYAYGEPVPADARARHASARLANDRDQNRVVTYDDGLAMALREGLRGPEASLRATELARRSMSGESAPTRSAVGALARVDGAGQPPVQGAEWDPEMNVWVVQTPNGPSIVRRPSTS